MWTDRDPGEVSWFQDDPVTSRRLVAEVAGPDSAIIDVGGGGSKLVDHLLADGFRDVTVLDVSEAALDVSRSRLGGDATRVEWIAGDVADLRSGRRFDIWHDRAVFHFLVDADARERYRRAIAANVADGGHLVVATFGPDGPERCSGLPVHRYDLDALVAELGPVRPVHHELEDHVTPAGVTQQFLVALLQYAP